MVTGRLEQMLADAETRLSGHMVIRDRLGCIRAPSEFVRNMCERNDAAICEWQTRIRHLGESLARARHVEDQETPTMP